MARARQIALALGCAVALAGLPGCDIVQGFKDAGDALFPPVKTYLDTPGFRLVSGGYSYLDMLTSSEPYILARAANPDDDSLYAMRFQAPHPCRIPDVTSYWSDGPDDAVRTYIAYFDGTGSGTLHFADMDCREYELTVEDANLPAGYTEDGLIVVAGGDLLSVNPEAGTTKVLASSVEEIASGHLVRAGGQLGIFDRDWTLIGWVGDGVSHVTTAFGVVYFEDTAGIHRLSVTTAPDPSVTESLVVPGACHLSVIPSTPYLELLSFYSPCADQTLAVWDAQTRKATPLDLPALPEYLKIAAARTPEVLGGHHPNLGEDPYWAVYLTEVDPATGTGTLVVRTPAGDELTLGEGAALERVELKASESTGDYTGGFALLDTQSGEGRFVRWDASGIVTDLAGDVVRQPANPLWNR
ncbi:MAG TPA: hypothetical protein VGQ57_04745, partial [Polyangiaceae bacterium]|nr:hypothetical protein [Polyangiaceae bacterium]